MFSREQIKKQIDALGIPDNARVLMHTSLRSVGQIEGGAQTLLDELVYNITSRGGIFCVPTHTWHNLGTDNLTLDMLEKDTCLGVFPTLALHDRRATRSLNPTHSMAVFGESHQVKDFIKDEQTLKTPTSPRSCYGKLDVPNGYVLLVGVTQNSNTYLHYVEEKLNIPNRIEPKPTKVNVRLTDGTILSSELYMFDERVHGDVSHKFYMYEPAFRAAGAIRDGTIGRAAVQLCNTVIMRETLSKLAANSPCGDPLLFDGEIPTSLYTDLI